MVQVENLVILELVIHFEFLSIPYSKQSSCKKKSFTDQHQNNLYLWHMWSSWLKISNEMHHQDNVCKQAL